ncbi:Kcnh2, partial [Symbiodinium sp. KB8]
MAKLEHLQKEGYVVLADVLAPNEVEEATDRFWSYLSASSAGAVQRESPLTWQSHLWPGQDYNGLINSGGIGQSDFMWYVRSNPKVIAAFADVWDVDKEDLIVSFDGCCAFRPPSIDPRWRTRAGWFHTDQNGRTTGSDFVCAQGLVALTDGDEATGGLAVLPGTHRSHEAIFQRYPLERENDFFILPRSDELLSEAHHSKPHIVKVKAGDLVLWDSRLIHCNVPAFHRFDEMPLDAALEDRGLRAAKKALLPEAHETFVLVCEKRLVGWEHSSATARRLVFYAHVMISRKEENEGFGRILGYQKAGASEHDTNWWWQRFVRWQQQGWSSQQIFSYLAAQGEGGHYADKWRNGRWGCGRSWEPQWEKSSGSEATSGWSERAEEQWAGDEEHDKKQHAWQGGWAKASSFDPWAQAAAAKLANNSRRESGQGSEGTGGERPSEKIPVPTFTGAAGEEGEVGSTARSYLRRVEAWERVTRMPAGQRGVALYTALKDKAWVEAEALDLNKLSGEQGAKYMKDFIKERYMDIEVTQVGRSMTQFFRVLKRNHDDSVRTFIGEFDRQVARLAEVQVVLPETVLAWMFLDKLRLDEAGEISLLASVRNEYSLKRLQEAALIHPE